VAILYCLADGAAIMQPLSSAAAPASAGAKLVKARDSPASLMVFVRLVFIMAIIHFLGFVISPA
jgi:hypothetical protein